MSAASRLAAADQCIVTPRPNPGDLGWQLGKNRADVPGGLGFELAAPVVVAGIEWTPDDGGPFASPIGAALAAELAEVSS